MIIKANRRTYPSERLERKILTAINAGMRDVAAQFEEQATVTAVLCQGAVDYAVYIGFGSPEWIAQNGNKLPYREAVLHFPGLQEDRYRE